MFARGAQLLKPLRWADYSGIDLIDGTVVRLHWRLRPAAD